MAYICLYVVSKKIHHNFGPFPKTCQSVFLPNESGKIMMCPTRLFKNVTKLCSDDLSNRSMLWKFWFHHEPHTVWTQILCAKYLRQGLRAWPAIWRQTSSAPLRCGRLHDYWRRTSDPNELMMACRFSIIEHHHVFLLGKYTEFQ